MAEAGAMAKQILTEGFALSAVSLYTGKDNDFTEAQLQQLHNILTRLIKQEPLQYILGKTSFMGFEMQVTPDVLIPRPETAELVEWVAASIEHPHPILLDIGTGSGCIAIALARLLSGADVHAWDISEAALSVARSNARQAGADIHFEQIDILSAPPCQLQYDALISNPPYITEAEKAEMQSNVLDWEPHIALFTPQNDPLCFYHHIGLYGLEALYSGGLLFFETNRLYAHAIANYLTDLGYEHVSVKKDMFGNDRMIKAQRP